MDHVKKNEHRSLEERGLHGGSFFEAHLHDGSVHHEKDTNWSNMSELVQVTRNGLPYLVPQCTIPLKHLRIVHNELETMVDIPEDCFVYQAVRSMAGLKDGQIIGRVVGLVRNGTVVEERYLNALTMKVEGIKF